ncbi:DUF4249 domain-containing protein [Dysgonomonas sp. OttesenSCG-928-D17]|nr:DUF4249 domain-containing protein [Dysgonomonas sp. OttesenSCG-928-D17]
MNKSINIYKLIFSGIVVMLLFSSCEKEIDVDLRSVPPKVVIEGIVKLDSLARVRVSETKDFSDNSGYPALKDAVVKIWDDAGNSETLVQDVTGWYVADVLKGTAGRTYNLSVTYDGTEYTSTSAMPPFVPIDSLTMYKILVMDYALPMVHYTDPVGKANEYYRAMVFINGKQHPDVHELAFSAEFMDGSPMHEILPIFTNDEDVDPIYPDDEIEVEFQCIDKGAYEFFKTLGDIENSLANPTTNIKGGALGYFSACTSDRMKIIAKW